MTNAEKYLKDGISIQELCCDFIKFCNDRKIRLKEENELERLNEGGKLGVFLQQNIKPTLTEDEIGYALTPIGVYNYMGDAGICCEDMNTEEDYDFIGQMSLKLLWNNTKRINDASKFVEYMCYDKEMKECVHDLKYSDCDKLLKILNGEEYLIEELLK